MQKSSEPDNGNPEILQKDQHESPFKLAYDRRKWED